jgi:hypothetical protein
MVTIMAMVMVPIMPWRFPGPVAVAMGPIGMATIGRIAIAAVTMSIGRAVMATAGKATPQRQQQQQHRKR